MRRFARSLNNLSRQGCGFLLLTAAFSCLFLIINAILVAALFRRFVVGFASPEFQRAAQLGMFALTVLMVFIEWWLVDWIVRRVSPPRD